MPLLGVHCAACGVREYRPAFGRVDYMRLGWQESCGWSEAIVGVYFAWICPGCAVPVKVSRSEQDELPLAVDGRLGESFAVYGPEVES